MQPQLASQFLAFSKNRRDIVLAEKQYISYQGKKHTSTIIKNYFFFNRLQYSARDSLLREYYSFNPTTTGLFKINGNTGIYFDPRRGASLRIRRVFTDCEDLGGLCGIQNRLLMQKSEKMMMESMLRTFVLDGQTLILTGLVTSGYLGPFLSRAKDLGNVDQIFIFYSWNL